MAAYEQRDNSGSLFRNDKGDNEKAPDYRGPCMVDGKELEVSAWLKTSSKGTKFMSLSFKPPFKKKNDERPAQRNDDEDIPF